MLIPTFYLGAENKIVEHFHEDNAAKKQCFHFNFIDYLVTYRKIYVANYCPKFRKLNVSEGSIITMKPYLLMLKLLIILIEAAYKTSK